MSGYSLQLMTHVTHLPAGAQVRVHSRPHVDWIMAEMYSVTAQISCEATAELKVPLLDAVCTSFTKSLVCIQLYIRFCVYQSFYTSSLISSDIYAVAIHHKTCVPHLFPATITKLILNLTSQIAWQAKNWIQLEMHVFYLRMDVTQTLTVMQMVNASKGFAAVSPAILETERQHATVSISML